MELKPLTKNNLHCNCSINQETEQCKQAYLPEDVKSACEFYLRYAFGDENSCGLNLLKAEHPELIYDLDRHDYHDYLKRLFRKSFEGALL